MAKVKRLRRRFETLADDYDRFGQARPSFDWEANVEQMVKQLRGEAKRLGSLLLESDQRRGARPLSRAIRELQHHLVLTTGRPFDREVAQFVNLLIDRPDDRQTAGSVEQVRIRHRPLKSTPEELVGACVEVFTPDEFRQVLESALPAFGLEPGTRVERPPLWSAE